MLALVGRSGGRSKSNSQKKANEEASKPPERVTKADSEKAFAEIIGQIYRLSQVQLVQLKSAVDSRLIPSGLLVTVARRKAISETLGGGNPSSSAIPYSEFFFLVAN